MFHEKGKEKEVEKIRREKIAKKKPKAVMICIKNLLRCKA
jgi:hypothetical protein